jgi:DNA-binding XRE family transcriptional regulator
MDLRDVFATNLRRLRNARGMSQDNLAYEAEVSRSYLSQLEKGTFYDEPQDYWPNFEGAEAAGSATSAGPVSCNYFAGQSGRRVRRREIVSELFLVKNLAPNQDRG